MNSQPSILNSEVEYPWDEHDTCTCGHSGYNGHDCVIMDYPCDKCGCVKFVAVPTSEPPVKVGEPQTWKHVAPTWVGHSLRCEECGDAYDEHFWAAHKTVNGKLYCSRFMDAINDAPIDNNRDYSESEKVKVGEGTFEEWAELIGLQPWARGIAQAAWNAAMAAKSAALPALTPEPPAEIDVNDAILLLQEIHGEHDQRNRFKRCVCWVCTRIDVLLGSKPVPLLPLTPEGTTEKEEKYMKTLREFVAEIASTMQCCCDLDNWQPEPSTGHSHVCRIHKAAMSKMRAQTEANR